MRQYSENNDNSIVANNIPNRHVDQPYTINRVDCDYAETFAKGIKQRITVLTKEMLRIQNKSQKTSYNNTSLELEKEISEIERLILM